MNDSPYRDRIARKLTQAFKPIILEIKDDSALHAGHAGQHPLGESHFNILIVSPVFKKMSRIARHQEVYRILTEEMKERIHALGLHILAPDEYTHR